MLDAAVEREIEDRILAEDGGVEIAGVNQQLVLFGFGFDNDLAIRIDDQAAADQGMAILDAGLTAADIDGVIGGSWNASPPPTW